MPAAINHEDLGIVTKAPRMALGFQNLLQGLQLPREIPGGIKDLPSLDFDLLENSHHTHMHAGLALSMGSVGRCPGPHSSHHYGAPHQRATFLTEFSVKVPGEGVPSVWV